MATGITNGYENRPTCSSCGRHDADLKLFRRPDGAMLCRECLKRVLEQRIHARRLAEERQADWRVRVKGFRDRLAEAARRADAAPAGDWSHVSRCPSCKAFCNAILRVWRRQGPHEGGPPPFAAVARELGQDIRKEERNRIGHEAIMGFPLRVEPLLRVLESWGARQDNTFELD